MPHSGRKPRLKNRLDRIRIHIPSHRQHIRLLLLSPNDRAIFQRHLIRAVIVAFEEEELVLMTAVQWSRGVFLDGEMNGFLAGRRGVCAGYGDGKEFGAAEAFLHVIGGGGEDGLVAVNVILAFTSTALETFASNSDAFTLGNLSTELHF